MIAPIAGDEPGSPFPVSKGSSSGRVATAQGSALQDSPPETCHRLRHQSLPATPPNSNESFAVHPEKKLLRELSSACFSDLAWIRAPTKEPTNFCRILLSIWPLTGGTALKVRESNPHHLNVTENLALSFFWFTSNMQWTALIIIVVPQLVLGMVGSRHSGADMSWLTASGALLASVIQPTIGALSDRSRRRSGRRRSFMIPGVIGTAGLLVSMGLVHHFAPFLLLYLGLQVFSNLASAPYQALIPDVVLFEQRGVASGYMGLMSQAAIIGGVLIPSFFSIRTTFEVLALLQLLGLVVTVLGVPEVPDRSPRARWNTAQFLRAFWISPKEHRDWWWVFATRLLVMLGFSTLEYYLYYYLHFVQHLANPNAMLDQALIAVTLASLLSVLTAGWLSDRLKRRKIMVIIGGLVMGVAALGFVFTHSLTMVRVFAAIFGLGYGTYLSTDWALAVDVLPPTNNAAKDMGLWSISLTLAQTIATAIAGLFLTLTVIHWGNATAYRALFVITFVYFLLGSLLVTRVRRVQ